MLWQPSSQHHRAPGKLYIAPGNGGTASCGENVVLDDCDPAAVAAFAQSHGCGSW